MSDLDRMFKPEQPHAFPICYGMKGYSLKTDILRSMIFHVGDECEKRNLHMPIISLVGQWYRVLVRDSNGYPLTKLQLQKDVFVEAKKTSQSEIINYIMSANMIQNVATLEDMKDKVEIQVIQNEENIHTTELKSKVFVIGAIKNGYRVRYTVSSLQCLQDRCNQSKINDDAYDCKEDLRNDTDVADVAGVVFRTISDDIEQTDEEPKPT
jgi:hypothetical protein